MSCTRQIVSLTRNARSKARNKHDADEQHEWMAGSRHDPCVDQPEETGEAQVGDHNHHAEQQGDGVEVDGAKSFLRRDRASTNHQAGAQKRRSRPVEVVAGELAEGHHCVGGKKDQDGGGGLEGRKFRFGQHSLKTEAAIGPEAEHCNDRGDGERDQDGI